MIFMDYYDKIQETVGYLHKRVGIVPRIAIVLGTGLGRLDKKIENPIRVPYSDIPHFPPVTVKGHSGELVFGTIQGQTVVAQSGRYHSYEGYDMKEVCFPIRVFKYLGAELLIIASATGGIHEAYEAGDVTVVNDHINLHHSHPLTGPNDERLGPRFPDMMHAYSQRLIQLCHQIALEKGIQLFDSVYGGLPGPNLETKAEYNFLHTIGATVVGMSTVPEIIVAQHMGMESCVLTAVTNKCFPISAIKETTHDDVIRVASQTEQKITSIVIELIERC